MGTSRLEQHPILIIAPRDDVPLRWQGEPLLAKAGETIAAALLAHGVRVFGHHPKDGSPQGLACANGQCAQCLVLVSDASGRTTPVKACMTPVAEGMRVAPLEGRPTLPTGVASVPCREPERHEVPVLIVGGGPAGLSAAAELGRHGVPTLLVDDKDRLGGKLVVQTHRFFGSAADVHAGTRGIEIAARLAVEAAEAGTVEVWPSSTVVAVFSDGWVGVLRGGDRYALVRPQALLLAAGSRERALPFRGNALPGVMGAGAFQTLLNRDQVRIAERLFVVGGGNVGLITAYHALQAGVEVVGLAEAAATCGGYRVHRDKLARLGVPILTSHTVVAAAGPGRVASVTVARVDERFAPVPGTERTFACDTLLVAVGLDPVDEFTLQARSAGLRVFAAGDCEEIAEASAAIFAGRIRGREIALALGAAVDPVPDAWGRMAEVLRSRPVEGGGEAPTTRGDVRPVFHCHQEIPCDPCASVCPQHLIRIDPHDIRRVPRLADDDAAACLGCERCVRICPGLAITLVDQRRDPARPTVTVPFEFAVDEVRPGSRVTVVDTAGEELGELEVARVKGARGGGGTLLVQVRAPASIAERIAGLRPRRASTVRASPVGAASAPAEHDDILCRCERVTAAEVRALIRAGHRDVNEIKALARVGMGACGAKSCTPLLERLFREQGVAAAAVTPGVRRPPFIEVPLGVFAGVAGER